MDSFLRIDSQVQTFGRSTCSPNRSETTGCYRKIYRR
jgi:hypothetical protein